MKHRSRRTFLKHSLTGVAAAGLAPTVAASAASQGSVAGANRRIRVGLIGCGGMGRRATSVPRMRHGAQCVALCDVDDDQTARTRELVSKDFEATPELTTRDFRQVLDRKDIDAVIVGTPDHWHALPDRDGVRGRQGRVRREAARRS
jgi:hypothetical protein